MLSLGHREILLLSFPSFHMAGRTVTGQPDEKRVGELGLDHSIDAVRVIFKDTFAYHLRFSWGGRISRMKEHRDHSGNCPIRKKFFASLSLVKRGQMK